MSRNPPKESLITTNNLLLPLSTPFYPSLEELVIESHVQNKASKNSQEFVQDWWGSPKRKCVNSFGAFHIFQFPRI